MLMLEFWKSWASTEASLQWEIYRTKPVPEVESVEANVERGVFVVHFVGGDKFDVAPSGIARPNRGL